MRWSLASFADRSDPLDDHRHWRWAQTTLQAFGAIALPGGYPNLLAGGNPERAAESYGSNVERLIKAKRQYDPDNVFCSAIPHRSVSTSWLPNKPMPTRSKARFAPGNFDHNSSRS
jgi:Berberine and berberine like